MLELLLVVLATVQLHFHDVLASPEVKVTDLWAQNFYNFTSETVEILKGKDDASHKVPSLPIFIPYCTNLATEVYVCTNGVLGLNRNECPFKPQAYGAEISSQWPLIAPFYADLTFNDPSDGKPPPYLGYGVFTIGSTMNHVVKRAKDDVNNYLKTTDFEAIQVVVVTWFNARAPFGSNGEGVTFQSAIITDGMRSFVRFSYGNMQWTANKNVQVGYKFPSLRDNCKVSFNIPLSGHGNLKFPLDKIDGNIDSKGVWMFQISSLRSPIDEVNDLDVTIITFASTKLKFGEPIVLVCKISFYSSPVYKWYQNSQIVEGQNKQVFEKAADTESEGTYRCEISINGKSKKSENSLDLNVFYLLKPNIIVKPSTNLVQSESLLLSCDVQSSKQPMFVWFKDDKLLQATESYLYFHQVTNENAGKYHCKCRSSVNEVVSDEVNISVKGIKVPVVTSSHSGQIDEGTDVTLTCTSEVENIQLSWYTKTKDLVHTGAVYKMEKITSKQTDEYFCKAKLDSNEVSSNVIKIQVKYCRVPFLSAVPSNEVTLGSSIQLTCVIDAFPSIKKYIWHKNSVFLKNTTENSITALMNNVEDQGQYECVVSCSDKLEKAKLNVKTKYLGQAVLTIQPEGFKKRYTSILLICQKTGYPTPSITWYHNNRKIEGETSKHLTISNATSQDEGEYYCNVENEVGRKTSEKKQVTLSYLDNPDITLSKSTLIEGESVTLTCSSQSFPQCTFKWKRNEQIISTNRQLIIERLSQSSNGLYVCVVTNEVGYEEKAINIVVKYMTSPAVTLCPETSHLALGTNTTLNCNVHASNIDRIQWLKNEKVLALNSTKLSLKNISLNDEGNYRCVAYGASQSKTSQVIQLSIAYLKEVTISINNSQPKSHDTIKLTCVVKGFPQQFKFQWRKGGEVIPQAKGSVLILNNVSEKDSGFYECLVENEGGVATSGSTINVYALSIPTLKIEPGTTLKRGQFASLICSTYANSKEVEYTWYKDGRVLPWNGRENFLQSVDVNEQGEYKCSADDGRQKKISTVIQLTVIYLEKPSIVNTTAIVANGSTQYFRCDVNGTSPIQYRWMKDGKIIVSNRQLIFKEVKPDDGGQYICIVKNEAGEETVDLQITVQYISKVELSIEPSATVNEGDTVLMFCKAKSPQPVIYSWYFEDNILQDNLQYKIINSVQLKNQGKYRCVAKNPMIGEKTSPSKEITINYLQPPMITITNTSITSTLNCSTRGSPHPSIRWIRNGVQVSSRAGHVINRKDYHKEITLLHCEVENAVAKLTSHVTEEKKYLSTPQLSRRPSGDVIEGQTILLFCQVDGSEPITYSWFHKDVLIAGNSSWYVLQNVSTSTNDGGYRCTASNVASTKSSKTLSVDVHYLRLPTIISTPTLRGSSSLLEGSSITLSCSIDGKPPPTVTWHFKNKQLTSLSTLTLSDLSPEQSGTYHCKVENNPLTQSSQIGIHITKLDKPRLIFPPEPWFKEGSSISIRCLISNDQNVTYTWLFNNVVIANATRDTLWKENLDRTDDGTLRCQTSTAYKKTFSEEKVLNIKYMDLPKITSNTDSFEMNAYTLLQLNCQSTSNIEVKYAWYNKENRIVSSQPSLKFENITVAEGGVYSCVITSTLGTKRSSQEIEVHYLSIPVLHMEPSTNVLKEDTAVLRCEVTSSEKDVSYSWLFGAETLATTKNNYLVLKNVSVGQSGNYSCLVRDSKTEKSSKTASLLVYYLNNAKISSTDTLIHGGNYTLSCSASGNPTPSFQWYFGGRMLSTQQNLRLISVDQISSGEYKCIATNLFLEEEVNVKVYVNVLIRPTLSILSSSRIFFEGESISLLCHSQISHNVFKYQWFHDQTPILNQHNSNLVLSNVTAMKDKGQYTCAVANDFIQLQSTEQTVDVIHFGTLSITKQSVNDYVGQSVSIHCSVDTSFPTPSFQWYHNNVLYSNQQNVSFVLTTASSGTYQSRVIIQKKEKTAQTQIDVKYLDKPEINLSAEKSTVLSNNSIILQCMVNASSATTYKWFFNKTEMFGETSSALLRNRIQPRESGLYECEVALEGLTKRSDSVHIKVVYLTVVGSGTESMTAIIGTTKLLECRAHGWPSPTYQWRHDGQIISKQEILSLDNVSITTAGVYECIVTNGLITRFVKTIISVPYLTSPTLKLSSSHPEEGSTLHLQCMTNSSEPTILYKWQQDGKAIHTSNSKDYFISNIYRNQGGSYFCLVSNAIGEKRSPALSVTVQYLDRPTIEQKKFNDTHLQLLCSAEGKPNIQYSWWHMDKVIVNKTSISVQQNDQINQYRCMVKNNVGEYIKTVDNTHSYITQPTLTVSPNQEIDENSCVVFYCHVEGTQPIRYAWYQNDVILSNQSNNVLTMENVKRSNNNALFHCRATNTAGWKQSSQKKITVRYVDQPTVMFQNEGSAMMIGETYQLTCLVTSLPLSSYKWYFNNRLVSQEAVLTLNDIHLNDEGLYTCQADNGFVNRSASYRVKVHSLPKPLLSMTPINSTITEHSNIMLYCQQNATDDVKTSWYRNSTLLEGYHSEVFILSNITRYQAGFYQCRIENLFGNALSDKLHVVVKYMDIISISPSKVDDSTTRYQCVVATNLQAVSFTWYLNNVKRVTNSSSIDLEEVQQVSSLKCIVSSGTQEREFIRKIDIQSLREPSLVLSSNHTKEGNDIMILCNTPYKGATFQWYHNNELIHTSASNTFQMTNIQRKNRGEYQCKIQYVKLKASSQTLFLDVWYLEKPEITTNKTIIRGNALQMKCYAASNRPLKYRWLKDGQLMGTNDSLHFKAITDTDKGLYTCVVNAESDEQRTSFNVKLQYLTSPIIKMNPSDVISEGNYVIIECHFHSSSTKVDISWYKDDKLLPTATWSKFILNDLSLKDGGRYKCKIQSEVDTKWTAPAVLTVHYLHTINLTKHTVNSTHIQYTCQARGSPPPSISWSKDGTLISTIETIIIRRNETDHKYMCQAQNAVALLSKTVSNSNNTYLETPLLSMIPRAMSREGETIALRCSTTGTPPIKYSIYHGSQLILSSDFLLLSNITRSKRGGYSCVAENEAERKESKQIVLEVSWLDELTIQTMSNEEGKKQLKCLARSSSPTITYKWYRNDSMISDQQTIIVARDERSDEPITFKCQVTSDSLTKQAERVIRFEYLSTPQLKLLSSADTKENDEVIFQCLYRSYPDVEKVQFLRNGIILKEGTENVFPIHNVSRNDSGSVYLCRLKNIVGEKSSKKLQLKIKYLDSPQIIPSKTSKLYEGTSISLRCHSNSTNEYKVTWLKNGVVILQNEKTLSFDSLRLTDEAVYSCSVKSLLGAKSVNYQLHVYYIEVPTLSFSGELKIQRGSMFNITCNLQTNDHQNVLYIWMKDGKRLSQTTTSIWSINSTNNETEGVYTCSVQLQNIVKKSKDTLTIKLAEEVKMCNDNQQMVNGTCRCLQSFYGLLCQSRAKSVHASITFTKLCRLSNKCYSVVDLKKKFQKNDFYQSMKQELEKDLTKELAAGFKEDHFIATEILSFGFGNLATLNTILYFEQEMTTPINTLQSKFTDTVTKTFSPKNDELVGSSLHDFDHCETNNCDTNADCINSKYTFLCRCRSGFHGNGKTCSIIVANSNDKNITVNQGKSTAENVEAFKNTTISLATLMGILLAVLLFALLIIRRRSRNNSEPESECDQSNDDLEERARQKAKSLKDHRGSCASTLNLTNESPKGLEMYDSDSALEDNQKENQLDVPKHKSSRGHPYETNNTSF